MPFPQNPFGNGSSATQSGSGVGPTMKRRPGLPVAPVTISTGSGGWSVDGATLSISPINSALSGTTGQMMRVTATNGGAADSFIELRRAIKVDASFLGAAGKIEVPVRYPFGLAAGYSLTVRVASDAPANDPPLIIPANRIRYIWPNSQIKLNQPQVFGVDMSCVLANQPNLADGAGTTVTGTAPNQANLLQLSIGIFIPAGSSPAYVDIGDITIGARSTPMISIGFDGAPSVNQMAYLARLAESYGINCSFSPQGQDIALNQKHLKRLYDAGHDILNEGRLHRNYVTNASLLVADALQTAAELIAAGMPRAAFCFAAPQNALNPVGSPNPGVGDLIALGFKSIRSGVRWNLPTPYSGQEYPQFGAYSGDLATINGVEGYVDNLELVGESGRLLFHDVFDNTTSGSATGLQVDLTVIECIFAMLAARQAEGRIRVVTESQLVSNIGAVNA